MQNLMNNKLFFIIIFMSLFSLFFIILIIYENFRPTLAPIEFRRVSATQNNLSLMHFYIDEFNTDKGRYPSKSEIEKMIMEKVGIANSLSEFISDPNGQNRVQDIMDGKGGWYYNSNTGDIKVNLTKSIIYYIPSYNGSDKNEIPSEWNEDN